MALKAGSWFFGLAVAAVLLVGCGAGDEAERGQVSTGTSGTPAHPQKLRVSLDGVEGAENVGILMAIKRGFFADVGLDVWAGSPMEPSRPVQYVAKGIDDFAVTPQPQILVGAEKGADVVAVGSLLPRATAALIRLQGSKVDGLGDLAGKTIGFPGVPFQKLFLERILAQAGLTLDDVRLENVKFDLVPSLLEGRVDAIFGGSPNLEGVELELAGEKPVTTPVRELGIPAYEECVVITRTALAAEDPELVRDFMSAVSRGTKAAIAGPKEAALVIKEAIGARPDLHRRDREAQLKATLPLLSTTGRMDSRQANELITWMRAEGLIQGAPPVSEVLSKDLPEQR